LKVPESLSRSEKILILLFFLTIPFVQPQVRDDGIGYYAWARSLILDHNLQFESDWKDKPLLMPLLTERNKEGRIIAVTHYTKTGHIENYFPIGPAMLWAPFLVLTHLAVLAAHHFDRSLVADGYSRPYLMTLAFATALYGFLGLWLCFRLARSYFEERWAFWATVGMWFASALPAYMYVDPAWSHAHSVFSVALFLWYWNRTRGKRTGKQWLVLGMTSGLMLDVYFANGVFLLAVLLESFRAYRQALRERAHNAGAIGNLLRSHLKYAAGALIAFLPTLAVRQVIFGNPLGLGNYANMPWNWTSPALWSVLFSRSHGALIWTPILIPAVIGLILFTRQEPQTGGMLLGGAAAYYYLIAVLPWWHGSVAFGSRYFISLTPIFVVGLSAVFSAIAQWMGNEQAAQRRIIFVTVLLAVWNIGLLFQWGTGMIANMGDDVVYNQFRVVPGELLHAVLPHPAQ
jgi:hypothetical protein